MDGDCLLSVSQSVAKAGHGLDTRQWGPEAIRLAIDEAVAFERRAREKQARKDTTAKRIAGKA
jgi:hypothetical protein